MSATSKPGPQSAVERTRESLAGSRLRKNADYKRVYAAAKKRRSASMSWYVARQAETCVARVGLTVGKVIGKAHERNRIKRRMRDVLRRHVRELPAGCDLVLHPQRVVLTMEFTKLEAEVVRILQQANAEGTTAAERDRSSRLTKAGPAL